MNQTCNSISLSNAFGGTFVFFSTHRPTLKKSKRATKPTHQDTVNMDRHSDRRESTTGNSGFKKLAVQWLNEHLCFVSSVVLADSFVLRNRQLLKPAKRYQYGLGDSANFERTL
jgi:hypothetical protein